MWFFSNIANILLFLLIIATVVAPTLIYAYQRHKIPKLGIGSYFKINEQMTTGPPRTVYYLKVVNTNDKSEGRVESCAGNIIFGERTYRTIWEDNRARHHSFGKEASLKLFDIYNNELNFTHAISERGLDVVPGLPIADNLREDIIVELEAAKGRCPSPHTETIEYIVNNAKYL
jgi:hypothetical protein